MIEVFSKQRGAARASLCGISHLRYDASIFLSTIHRTLDVTDLTTYDGNLAALHDASPPAGEGDLVERVERALVLAAYLLELDGDAHVPLYERLERELEQMRQRADTKARARRLLAKVLTAAPGRSPADT